MTNNSGVAFSLLFSIYAQYDTIETDRQTDRQRERKTDRKTGGERDREGMEREL